MLTANEDSHGQVMARMTRGLYSDRKIANLVAYIGDLPGARPATTIDGNPEHGKNHYAACVACHGATAEGNATLNAPTLVTTGDWYQVRQLKLFKAGLRGAHAQDIYGQQMRAMAAVLAEDAAILDVVSYINSLR